jgi:putative ABC transport system permease protein
LFFCVACILINMKEPSEKLPRWPIRFLRAICPEDLLEEIEGDLIQRYEKNKIRIGLRKARWQFALSTLSFFRPGIILRNKFSIPMLPLQLIANYFSVSSRILLKNKFFSMINILGLAFGITGSTLLFLWIQNEFSYDRFHEGGERIYKVWNRSNENGQVNCWDITPRVLSSVLRTDHTSVEAVTSYADYNTSFLFSAGETKLLKNTGVYTDPEFLQMFSFPMVKGNSKQALADPSSIVVTEKFAKQLFGDKDAFGQNLTISYGDYKFQFAITGILKDLPSNTDFQFEFIIPWRFLDQLEGEDTYWGNNSVSTFVKVKDEADVVLFENGIKSLRKKNTNGKDDTELFLHPLHKMRLYSGFENGVQSGGKIDVMRMLGILGLCLVCIACINFINLSTARAQRRSKEVAVRKVSGALRSSLVVQFICESVLIAFAAGVVSLGVVYMSLPAFSTLIREQLTLNVTDLTFWLITSSLILGVGILAGVYPAFYLSSFKPVGILKGTTLIITRAKSTLRNSLVVIQFGFAFTLIVSTIVISNQIEFVQNRETGYDRSHLMFHSLSGNLINKYEIYKNELLQSGVATSITKTSGPITQRMSSTNEIRWEGKDPGLKVLIERIHVDEDFINTAGLTLIDGRDMDLKKFPSDSSAVILNESAVQAMGFKKPIGQTIIDSEREWTVIGVVKDFILTSPYQKVEPMVLLGSKINWFDVVHVRLNKNLNTTESLSKASAVFKKYNPDYPFDFHFVDLEYNRKFAGSEKTKTITTLFTGIAIFIACLGLLGLSTYVIESRIKEIGIRKVLGSSVSRIISLLGKNSLKPILISMIIFSPMAWFSMNWWLQTFAYRISLGIWPFILATTFLLLIAIVTIIVQTYRAANANPVTTLRSE